MVLDTITSLNGAIRLAIAIIVFAAIGAGHTLWAAHNKGERWDSHRARGEIIALGVAGAAAGIFVFYTGNNIGGVVFTAAVVVGGQIIREAFAIADDSYDRYEELVAGGVDPSEAAMVAIAHGMKQNNPEEVIEGIRALVEISGQPSQATANQRADELEDTYREEGAQAAIESTRREAPEPEPPEFDDDIGGADSWGSAFDDFEGEEPEYPDADADADADADGSELEDEGADETTTNDNERILDGP